jgi:hypothetical protein
MRIKETCLLYLFHVNALHYYELRDLLNIGRTTGEIICPDDGRMSGKHARIWVEIQEFEKTIYVEDLGSKNKTILDRMEIAPQQKTKLTLNTLLEIGNQQFIATESSALNLQEINAMIQALLLRPIVRFDQENQKQPEVLSPPPAPKTNPLDEISAKEGLLEQMQKDLMDLEQNTRNELLKMEEEKQKLVSQFKDKKVELTKQSQDLKIEIEAMRTEVERIRLEVEQKKKKIINLKDLPTDSSD